MLTPLSIENASQYQRTTLLVKRPGTGVPQGIKIGKLIGKGSNNSVFLAKTKDNQEIIVRFPRTNSDTQRIGNATWEFRNSLIAANAGAAPLIYDAWYTRHMTQQQKSGLHMITDYYPIDVHEFIMENHDALFQNWNELRRQCVSNLRNMAKAGLFCYDLKPSNMVARISPFTIKFIDFGRDFAEWRQYSAKNEHIERAPVLSYIQKIVEASNLEVDNMTNEDIYYELIFVTMLILLSSNIDYTIQQSTTAIRKSFASKHFPNFLFEDCAETRKCIHPSLIPLVKEILRHRDVKDTIRHYTGRRNCGTKRTFAYSGFGPINTLSTTTKS